MVRDEVVDVKQLLLPPSPVEATLERLVEKLPRRLLTARVEPIKDIVVLDSVRGEYKATGSDPWFELILGEMPAAGAWLYLEGALVRNNGCRVSTLRVQVGSEAQGVFCWPITTNFRGSIREVVYLPPGARRLTWQPTTAPGYFSQSTLQVHLIGDVESAARRLHRVLHVRTQFKATSTNHRGELGWWRIMTRLRDAHRYAVQLRASHSRGDDYASFLARQSHGLRADLSRMRKLAAARRAGPLISLVLSIDRADSQCVGASIDSVVAQIYANWELHIVANSDIASETVAQLQSYQEREPRVKLYFIGDPDAVLSDRLNHALRLAGGSHVARIGEGDILAIQALFEVSMVIEDFPKADLVYSDMDRIAASGDRCDPAFKPDWNPDLLLSHNYIGGLAVMHRERAVQLGGYRRGFDGAEDYDLLLRMVCDATPVVVKHIPRVLYSTRTIEAGCSDARVSHLAGLRALQELLAPRRIFAEAQQTAGLYVISYPLPDRCPLVSIIVPTRDRLDVLEACVSSICRSTNYPHWELLILDNRSAEPETLSYLRKVRSDERIRVIEFDRPFNYSAINNFAVSQARGEVLALVNNDVEVISPGWLTEMVSHALRPEVGAVGAKLLYANGTVQHAGVILGVGGVAGHAHKYLDGGSPGYCGRAVVTQNLSAVTGACLVVRKSIYESVGGMNETDLAIALNDVDFCLKLLEAGYRNVFTPFATLYHHESISRGRNDSPQKQAVFLKEYNYVANKWRKYIQHDPCYNENLTLQFEDFSLRSL